MNDEDFSQHFWLMKYTVPLLLSDVNVPIAISSAYLVVISHTCGTDQICS